MRKLTCKTLMEILPGEVFFIIITIILFLPGEIFFTINNFILTLHWQRQNDNLGFGENLPVSSSLWISVWSTWQCLNPGCGKNSERDGGEKTHFRLWDGNSTVVIIIIIMQILIVFVSFAVDFVFICITFMFSLRLLVLWLRPKMIYEKWHTTKIMSKLLTKREHVQNYPWIRNICAQIRW